MDIRRSDQYNFNQSTFTNNDISFGFQEPLANLPCVHEARHDSAADQYKVKCLVGTRENVLHKIEQWAKDSNAPALLWLSGMSGTGKSTIARTIAQTFQSQCHLAATFFFSRGAGDRGNASKFVTTVASQIAGVHDEFMQHIREIVRKKPDIVHLSIRQQWKDLVDTPLARLSSSDPRDTGLILIVDALDECDKPEDVELLAELMLELCALNSRHIRIFVTSRPESSVASVFSNADCFAYRRMDMDDIERSTVESDISLYIEKAFYDIRSKLGHRYLDSDWPGEVSIQRLVRQAEGIFQFAATACKFISESVEPEQHLAVLLDELRPSNLHHRALDRIYLQVLDQLILRNFMPDEKERFYQNFRSTVGSLILLFDPLSIDALATLSKVSLRTASPILDQLRSIVRVPEDLAQPLKLLHTSFREFLLDSSRCTEKGFTIYKELTHAELAQGCLELMSKTLKKDICNLKFPGFSQRNITEETITSKLPPDLRYACRYWIDHMQCSGIAHRLGQATESFFQKDFLHWLEAMSIMGNVQAAVSSLGVLQKKLEATQSKMAGVVRDGKHFLLRNRSMIKAYPLQIYAGALLSYPKDRWITTQYAHALSHLIHNLPKPGMLSPSPILSTFRPYGYAFAAACSPRGDLLASGGNLSTQIWDITSGELLHTVYKEDYDYSTTPHTSHLLFSPCGKYVIHAHGSITVLNSESGGVVNILYIGSFFVIQAIMCARESTSVVFLNDLGVLTAWNFITDKQVTLRKFAQDAAAGLQISGAAFSSDYSTAVAIMQKSREGTQSVMVWSTTSGESWTVDEHVERCNTCPPRFSKSGRLVIYEAYHGVFEIYDVDARCVSGTLVILHSVNDIAFTQDDDQVVAICADGLARFWGWKSGVLEHQIQLANKFPSCLWLSLTESLLICITSHTRVHVYDIIATRRRPTAPTTEARSISGIQLVVFSSIGGLVATLSEDLFSIKLWDSTNGVECSVVEAESRIYAMGFFQQHNKLMVVATESCLWIWDIQRSVRVITYFYPEGSQVSQLKVSPNDEKIALEFSDGGFGIWEPASGRLRWRVISKQPQMRAVDSSFGRSVCPLTFSPDGAVVAFCDFWGITLLDLTDGKILDLGRPERLGYRGYRGHGDHLGHLQGLFFSPDGHWLLASGSSGDFIYRFSKHAWTVDTAGYKRRWDATCIDDSDSSFGFDTMVQMARRCDKNFMSKYTCDPSLWFKPPWIYYGNMRLLRFPHNSRTSKYAYREDLVALAVEGRSLAILRFNLEEVKKLAALYDRCHHSSQSPKERSRFRRSKIIARMRSDHSNIGTISYDGSPSWFGWCSKDGWPEVEDRTKKMPTQTFGWREWEDCWEYTNGHGYAYSNVLWNDFDGDSYRNSRAWQQQVFQEGDSSTSSDELLYSESSQGPRDKQRRTQHGTSEIMGALEGLRALDALERLGASEASETSEALKAYHKHRTNRSRQKQAVWGSDRSTSSEAPGHDSEDDSEIFYSGSDQDLGEKIGRHKHSSPETSDDGIDQAFYSASET